MVIVNQGEQRTVTVEQLATLYQQGTVTDGSFVWRDGMGDWKPLSEVPELRAAMPAEPEEVSAHEEPAEMDDSMPTTMLQSPVAAPPPAAPRPAAGAAPFPAPAPAAGAPWQPSAPAAPAPPARFAPHGTAVMPTVSPPVPAISPGPPSGGEAARRPGPARPDLVAAAVATDVALAQAAGQAPPPAQAGPPVMQNRGGQLVFPQKESSMLSLSTNFFLAKLDSPRRKKRVLAAVGVGAMLLTVGAIMIVRSINSREQQAVENGWKSLHGCLLGEPLKERETVGERVRNIQLAVVGTPVERRAKPGQQAWPLRCAPVAHELAEHARAAGGDYAPIHPEAEALSKALTTDSSATSTFSEQAEKLWAASAKAKLKAADKPGDGAAPRAAAALGHEAFVALPKFLAGNFSVTNVRPAAAGPQAVFVIDQPDLTDGPHVCSVGATGNAKCSKVAAAAAKLAPGLRLQGHVEDGAAPYLFAGDHGQSGLLRPESGESITTAYVLGALSRKDGSLWALTRSGAREARLLHVPKGGRKAERPGARDLGGDALVSATLAGDWLAYRTGPKASPASRLVLRKLADGNAEPAAAIEAGDVEEAPPTDAPEPIRRPGRKAPPPPAPDAEDERAMVSCRADDTVAVRVRTTRGDAVSVLQAGRWSAPQKSPSTGGAFTCRKGEATSVKVTPAMEQDKNWASISHVRCTSATCTPTTVTMKDLLPGLVEAAPIDDKAVLALDLDGKLLVVWNAGYVGGIRMRLAAPGQLKDTDDTVLVDARDPKNPMKLTVVTEMKLLPAGSSAILLLGGPSGARALRIDPSGAFSAVQATVQ